MTGARGILHKAVLLSIPLLILTVHGWFFSGEFFSLNMAEAREFVLSLQFLFFVVLGVVLSRKWVPNRWYDIAVFTAAVFFSLVFYGRYLDIFRMAGDNLCQIAYWKILFHPSLSGSTSAAFTKPGQLLILGMLYQGTLLLGPYLFKVGLSLVMGACIWAVTRVATDIGGRFAGVITFPVVVWGFAMEFVEGSASIFLIPCLFAGSWLYFYRPRYKNIGRLLLVATIQFHIHAIAVLGVIFLFLLFKKEWKELGLFSLYGSLSIALWVEVIYLIQGSMARLNSGAAAGYVAPLEGMPDSRLTYMFEVLREGFVQQPAVRTLFILMAIGVIGAVAYGYRHYLVVFASVLVLAANVAILGGTFNLERYCATFYAFGCAVGIGTIVRYATELRSSPARLLKAVLSIAVLVSVLFLDFSYFNLPRQLKLGNYDTYIGGHYVASARNLLADPFVEPTVRLLTEDDIIYSLIVLDPVRFTSLAALQQFNVLSVAERKKVLSRTDQIWISLTDGHPYYYLFHLPEPKWEQDDFRRLVVNILRDNRPGSLYGFKFIPVHRTSERLLLKVLPAG